MSWSAPAKRPKVKPNVIVKRSDATLLALGRNLFLTFYEIIALDREKLTEFSQLFFYFHPSKLCNQKSEKNLSCTFQFDRSFQDLDMFQIM